MSGVLYDVYEVLRTGPSNYSSVGQGMYPGYSTRTTVLYVVPSLQSGVGRLSLLCPSHVVSLSVGKDLISKIALPIANPLWRTSSGRFRIPLVSQHPASTGIIRCNHMICSGAWTERATFSPNPGSEPRPCRIVGRYPICPCGVRLVACSVRISGLRSANLSLVFSLVNTHLWLSQVTTVCPVLLI